MQLNPKLADAGVMTPRAERHTYRGWLAAGNGRPLPRLVRLWVVVSGGGGLRVVRTGVVGWSAVGCEWGGVVRFIREYGWQIATLLSPTPLP